MTEEAPLIPFVVFFSVVLSFILAYLIHLDDRITQISNHTAKRD